MKETFFQKLQRVKPSDVLHIFLFMLALLPAGVCRLFRRNLWLVCDNRNEARDNGYRFFKYLREEHPEQDVVYAISKRSPDYSKVRGLGKTVSYGSLRHWVLYLAARINISSQKGGKPNAAVCYFLEVKGILKNTRVFLQHGIIKDDMDWLHYENTKMRMFVTSTEREYRFLCEKFGYPEGYIVKTGLCRFDDLQSFTVRPRQILLMPTWRSWIATPTSASKEIEDVSDFRKTGYFKAWNSFLKSPELDRMLRDNDLTLIFYPHRDMQKYLSCFEKGSDRIELACWPESDVQTLLKESAYLVTDFSSIAMDFAYMKQRLMYYQFDYEDFRRGQYAEGYFDYERDGFGRVCYTLDEALDEIKTAIAQGFAEPEEYLARRNDFFDLCDDKNCERTYLAVRELMTNGKKKRH